MTNLAENLKFLRKKFGLSQTELAEKIGLNRGNIASYEKGSAEPKISNLLKIVNFFNIELLDLVENDLSSDSHELPEKLTNLADHQRNGKKLTRLDATRDHLESFIQKTEEMDQILQGFKSFHRFRERIGLLGKDQQELHTDYQRLLTVFESVIEENKELVEILQSNTGEQSSPQDKE